MKKLKVPAIWEDLTEEEQEEWNKRARENQGQIRVLKGIWELRKRKRCIYCSKEMDVVYEEKDLKDRLLEIGWLGFFTSDYLFHLKSTHGYEPQIFLRIIRTIINKINELP